MPALNSLVTQPGNTQPPQVQGSSGGDQASGLQGPVQGGGAAPQQGATGIPQQGDTQQQPPSHQEVTALLQHMGFFRRRWAAILNEPEIGTKNVRPEVYELMADALSDDYVSLPDVMGQLKTLPTDPLEQKQWLEEHVQKNDQAMQSLLQYYATSRGPMGSFEQESAGTQSGDDRADLVKGAVSRFKSHPKRPAQAANNKGIPIRA